MTDAEILDHPELLTGEQVATRLGVSRQRVQQLTGRPDFPPPVGRVGKAVVWRAPDVDDYANGIRKFFTVNAISIGIERAQELAARLERARHGDQGAASGKVAAAIRAKLDTGGGINVTGDEAVAVFGALQHWLEDTDIDVFGEELMALRWRLFGQLQDAGVFK